jgi:hypothetical protein
MKNHERHRYPPAGTVAPFAAAVPGLIGNALRSAMAGAREAA